MSVFTRMPPRDYDFTEEHQVVFLEGHLEQMEKLPWLAGFHWWVFADFGSSYRGDSIPHVNLKGLVSFWREKKEKNLYEKLGEGRDQ